MHGFESHPCKILHMIDPALAPLVAFGTGITTTPSGPMLEPGQVATVEILGQEWVKPRPRDIKPKDKYIFVHTNKGYLLLAQVEKHTYPDRVEFKRTLVEIQELNEAS